MPIVDGASRPSGIAVTSLRPVRRARRIAITVYTTSPNKTPSAVPGNILVYTSDAGKPKPATRITARTARLTTLSSINPKNALTSPAAAHLYFDTCADDTRAPSMIAFMAHEHRMADPT